MHFFLKILDLLYGKIHMNSEDKISMSFGKETGTSYLVNIAPAFIRFLTNRRWDWTHDSLRYP